MLRRNIAGSDGRNGNAELSPMVTFLVSTALLVCVNIAVDHEARREGFDEQKGGVHLGT
jgi:hypothetical protein